MLLKTDILIQWGRFSGVFVAAFILVLTHPSAGRGPSDRVFAASDTQRVASQLSVARKLLSEVERSPSANLDELRTKLRQARAAAEAVLTERPQHPEAIKLLTRIDAIIAQLGPKARPDHPVEAEADATLDRLDALVKGNGPRAEVEAVHTNLRKLVTRLTEEKRSAAILYEKRAKYLWALYASGLGKIRDVCPGCPVLDLAALAKGFDRPRLLGAGDYTLDDLADMQGYTPLLTGDFNRDGTMDVALIGLGKQRGKEKLFLLIASVPGDGYRRLFLLPLDWPKAALAASKGKGVRAGTIIFSNIFAPSDDYWTLRWNGKNFVLRYFGDEMDPDCDKSGALDLACAEKLIVDLPEVQALVKEMDNKPGVTPTIVTESEPEPHARPGTKAAAYRIYFGEDHQTRTVRLLTFEVDVHSKKIFVYDAPQSKRIPLEEWRKQKRVP